MSTMKHNYTTLRKRLQKAIVTELLAKDGEWPGVKAKVREYLSGSAHLEGSTRPYAELHELADAAAAAVLNCNQISVVARRQRAIPS